MSMAHPKAADKQMDFNGPCNGNVIQNKKDLRGLISEINIAQPSTGANNLNSIAINSTPYIRFLLG